LKVDFTDIELNTSLAIAESSDVVQTSDLIDRVVKRRTELDQGIHLPWPKVAGAVKLRRGEMILMGGYSGHFKSTLASQMGLAALQQGFKVGIASLELVAEDTVEHYAEIAAASTEGRPPIDYVKRFATWAQDKLFFYDRVDAIEADVAIQMVLALIVHKGCDLIVLDALMMMGVCDDLERERRFCQTLQAIVKKHKVTVILVHHMRKPGPGGEAEIPGKYSFIGSSHIANMAPSIFITWHDKAQNKKKEMVHMGVEIEDFDPDKRDMLFCVVKQRNARFEGQFSLWSATGNRGFSENPRRRLAPLELPQ
jgi:twinkle protein